MRWQTAHSQTRWSIKLTNSSSEESRASRQHTESTKCFRTKSPTRPSSPTGCASKVAFLITDHWALTRWTQRRQESCWHRPTTQGSMICCPMSQLNRSLPCSTRQRQVLTQPARTRNLSQPIKTSRLCSTATLSTRFARATTVSSSQTTTTPTTSSSQLRPIGKIRRSPRILGSAQQTAGMARSFRS